MRSVLTLFLIALIAVLFAEGALGQTTAPDVTGRDSGILASRDVRLGGVSVVGRWQAVEVIGDREATFDLQDGRLSKVLVVNPTGRATLRGLDRDEGGSMPATFPGRIEGDRLRLLDLDGTARLALVGGRLHVNDPSGATTVYAWRGR